MQFYIKSFAPFVDGVFEKKFFPRLRRYRVICCHGSTATLLYGAARAPVMKLFAIGRVLSQGDTFEVAIILAVLSGLKVFLQA